MPLPAGLAGASPEFPGTPAEKGPKFPELASEPCAKPTPVLDSPQPWFHLSCSRVSSSLTVRTETQGWVFQEPWSSLALTGPPLGSASLRPTRSETEAHPGWVLARPPSGLERAMGLCSPGAQGLPKFRVPAVSSGPSPHGLHSSGPGPGPGWCAGSCPHWMDWSKSLVPAKWLEPHLPRTPRLRDGTCSQAQQVEDAAASLVDWGADCGLPEGWGVAFQGLLAGEPRAERSQPEAKTQGQAAALVGGWPDTRHMAAAGPPAWLHSRCALTWGRGPGGLLPEACCGLVWMKCPAGSRSLQEAEEPTEEQTGPERQPRGRHGDWSRTCDRPGPGLERTRKVGPPPPGPGLDRQGAGWSKVWGRGH